ncbi:MAG TPA: hypothetical protein GX736_03190 [Mogibacterium sp.]|nr:hypothetical protein [Mogibacterium sp.]
MKKIYKYIIFVSLIILTVSIIALGYYKISSYSLSGTYSAGNEPDNDNRYMVIKGDEFILYDQQKIIEDGSISEINLNNQSNIYRLISKDNTMVGYIVHDKDYIVLLDFNGTDYSLKKISANAIFLDFES